jgi:hypothetical protein
VQVEVQVQDMLQMKVQLMLVLEDQLEVEEEGDAVGEEEGEGDLVISSAFKCVVSVVTCYVTFVTHDIRFLLDL